MLLIPISVFASDSTVETVEIFGEEVTYIQNDENSITVIEDNGEKITDLYRDSNGHIYVNGKDITTEKENNSETFQNERMNLFSDQWIYAGSMTLQFNIAGLTVAAVSGILGLIKTSNIIVALAAIATGAGAINTMAGTFKTGAYIDDVQHTYYKNLEQWGRPDMRIEHSFYFRFEAFGNQEANRFLGNVTTYA